MSATRIGLPWIVVSLAAVWLVPLSSTVGAAEGGASGVHSVRDHGARGDGKTLDTDAIHAAIEACASAGGGQVLLPPGRYLSGTVHLKSRVTLKLADGARLVGTPDLEQYQHYSAPEKTPEARSGRWHRALILAVGVEDVAIVGPGTIDGAKVFDPRGEERMRGPHTIIVGGSKGVTIRDVDIVDSANYAILIEYSSQVEVRRVKVTGGWDGVHFRGWVDQPCRDLSIVSCQFFTGDDSIAGRYVENLLISDCVINTSCNGIRLIGPARRMIVHDCLFYGPGLHPHRSQSRHNMLAGIILQPGAWDPSEGAVDDVLISDVTMKDVQSAVTMYLRRPGNTLDNVVVSRLSATGVYLSATSVESWSEAAVGRVVFRDVSIEHAGGGKAEDADRPARAPGVGVRSLPGWGLYARNVKELILENVRLGSARPDLRPVVHAEGVQRLSVSELRYSRFEGAREPILLKDSKLVDDGHDGGR